MSSTSRPAGSAAGRGDAPGAASSRVQDGWRALLLEMCPFRLRLPADEAAPSIARNQLRRWLVVAAWPRGAIEDLTRAVDEAVTNAVEHAYPDRSARPAASGTTASWIDVWATPTVEPGRLRRVSVVVRDHGRWRPALAQHVPGHGIAIMRTMTESMVIELLTDADGLPAGTSVTLNSRPVPPTE